MIKVPYTVAELDLMAEDYYKEILADFAIPNVIAGRAADLVTPVFTYLNTGNNLENIIKGKPEFLENELINITPLANAVKAAYIATDPLLTPDNANTWFKNKILEVFNYDTNHLSFTKRFRGRLAYNCVSR